MPTSAKITGIFCSNGACWKCSSMSCIPASNSWKLSTPIANIIDRPIALSSEYLPPTQSQNSNILAVSIPNFSTSSELVDSATKCFATADSSPSARTSHCLAVRAFVIVSSVVNVLLAIKNSVSDGSKSRRVSAICVPSTLDTK